MYKVHLLDDKVHLGAIKLQFVNLIAKCVHNPTLPRCIRSQCAFLQSRMGGFHIVVNSFAYNVHLVNAEVHIVNTEVHLVHDNVHTITD